MRKPDFLLKDRATALSLCTRPVAVADQSPVARLSTIVIHAGKFRNDFGANKLLRRRGQC